MGRFLVASKMEKQTGRRVVSISRVFASPDAELGVLSGLCDILKREFPDCAADIFQSVVRVGVGNHTSCRCFSEKPHEEQV